MIDFEREQPLTLNDLRRHCPKVGMRGQRPSLPTLWRWCRIGIVAGNGERVTLEYGRVGRTIVSSREALTRFFNALSELDRVPKCHRPRSRRESPPKQDVDADRKAQRVKRAAAEVAGAWS
jgi:hypothetical protein